MPWNYYSKDLVGVDLREEIRAFLYGNGLESPKGRPAILRKMTDNPCACYDPKTGSPSPHCRYCQGEGFQFHEKLIERVYIARSFGSVLGASTTINQQGSIAQYGYTDPQRAVAYVEAAEFPDYERYTRNENRVLDKLYELKVDEDGEPVRPFVRAAKWKVKSVIPHHGDLGRVELIELGLDKENL